MNSTETLSVVVFGASISGRRVLAQLRRDQTATVTAFVDNAASQQGTTFEGLPVIAPRELQDRAYDRIVVASHAWRDIVAQLRALGVPEQRIQIDDAVVCPAVPSPVETTDARLARMMSDKVHYACGRRVLDGWLNIDMFDDAYPIGPPENELRDRIFYADLRASHPFADDTFQFAYCEDFLEHLTQADSLIFLAEAYRTLRPGGVFRISTPGLPGVLRRHLRSSDREGATSCVQEAYVRWHHLHFYSFESLQTVARHLGFRDVTRCDYGQSQHADLRQESRPDQADLNLVVELTK